MKTLLPFVLVLCLTHNISAQSHRFADTTAQWSLLTSNLLGEYYATTQFYVTSDTVINGISYQRINTDIFIRKDTSEKVYVLYGDTCEQLIYDFDPVVGDTFCTNLCANNPNERVTCRIDSIDSIFIGRTRKVIHVSYKSAYLDWSAFDIWIEGIGCQYSELTFPGSSWLYIDGDGHQLLCYHENGIRLYHDSSDYYRNVINQESYLNACDRSEFIFLGINDIVQLLHTIFPNPATSNFTITLSQQPKQGTALRIYDAVGKVIRVEELTGTTQQVSTAALPNGLYTYAIHYQNIKQTSGKLVVSH